MNQRLLLILAIVVSASIAIAIQEASATKDWYDARDFYKMLNTQEKYYTKYYDDDDKKHFDGKEFFGEQQITIRIVADNKKNVDMPDFEVSTKSSSEFIDGDEFEDDDRAKTTMVIDEDDKRICIEALDTEFKTCKNIKNNSDEVSFVLR